MFFLLLLVMFLGALVFAYDRLTKANEHAQARDRAVAEAKQLTERGLLTEHYIEDVGRVIGKDGSYEGREVSRGSYGGAKISYLGLMNPAEIKKLMDDACANARLGPASGLPNVLNALVTQCTQLEQRAKSAETERDKALNEKSEVDRKFQAATADAQARARDFNSTLEQARSDFETAKQDKDRNIALLQQNLQAKVDELTTTKEAAAAAEKALRQELAKKDMHNSALVTQNLLRNAVDQADGKVVSARTGVVTAFVNLGRKDNLQPGTIFRVKNPHSTAVKGYATVTRVEDQRAEVELSSVVDPIGDAVREGDLLYNELYSPNMTRTIFLMGHFSAPYEKGRLALLLKRLGNKVVDKIGPGVDTVILGNDPVNETGDGFAMVKDSPEYKEAYDLRVEFAPLAKIRDLIKL
ncbi:MAG: hypothetical protein FJ265_01575 [Planctomycetes bacterium]|nr:hypothetical protein [Planctomycetota bacterium]